MVTDKDPRTPNQAEHPPRREPPELEMLAGEALGGESACYAHLVCEECGAMTTEGHHPSCIRGAAEPD
jgi:hypothetical protein